MINRDLPVPPYRQLTDLLRTEITTGRLEGKLPGERYLADQYDCAVNTVRKAIGILRDEGLIESVQGLGNFVVPPGSRPLRPPEPYSGAPPPGGDGPTYW